VITALCGGVGGSKLALGLYRTLAAGELSVIVNTADDLDFSGLRVCPDLDTVAYTLAGLARADVGWGLEGDTSNALSMLARYGVPDWFQVGDMDLATDVFRTARLNEGASLTAVTRKIAEGLGVDAAILPMTDGRVETGLLVADEWLHFQEYFVRRRHKDPVDALRYKGIDGCEASPEVLEAIGSAEVIVIVNSNPVLSILPILAVPGINEALFARGVARVAVSPIVGEDSVTGPAGRLMSLIGQPSSALGVARSYAGVIDGMVIDNRDGDQAPAIRDLGLAVLCTETVMADLDGRIRLATETLDFARSIA
jgi:LPPG:FO 2-phospho-L-lactate transferase